MSQSVFDSSAATYDEEFTHTPIGIMQRRRVYKYLLPLLNKNTKLLEINCGTGHDAITLSKYVKQVLATDISLEMINTAKQKTQLNSNIEFRQADIRNLNKVLTSKHDILFSDFGGLNCLSPEELVTFASEAPTYLTEKAKLVLVIMGKKCWIENIWFRLRSDKRHKRRDTDKGLPTSINGTDFYTYYYTPKQIENFFEKDFKVKQIKSVGLFIPPSYLNTLFKNKKWLLSILNAFESLLGGISALANYADHYLIYLERK